MTNVVLTLLYVPADRGDRAEKAFASEADVVILDLEDAVAPSGKAYAREFAAQLVTSQPDRPVQIRINGQESPWAERDLAMVGDLPPQVGIRVPKVVSAKDVANTMAAVGERPIHCLIESAAGVEAAGEIARVNGVASVSLGEADLRSDLGVADDAGLSWCRQRLVVAARAANLPPPTMAAFTNVSDLDGLAASCREGKNLGFVGRTAIHPRQVPVIEKAFTPTQEETERARAIVDAVEQAASDGSGTVVLADGSFLDVAMVEHARRVLALAQRGQESM